MAAVTNYNIKQVTNYDIQGNGTVDYNIAVPRRNSTPNENGEYDIINSSETVPYKTALSNIQILKLGYCCEPKGALYPIFLEINGSYKEIKIGRDGIYEMQPETWTNINDSNAEEKTSNVIITGVRVPAEINFTLDYVVAIN